MTFLNCITFRQSLKISQIIAATPTPSCYLRRKRKDAILQRVQLARAQYTNIARFAAAEAELLVASQISIQVAQHPGRLHLNGCHLSDRLHMEVMLGEFIANVIVLGQNDHLDDHVGFLLGAQPPIQRIQLADGQKSLRKVTKNKIIIIITNQPPINENK